MWEVPIILGTLGPRPLGWDVGDLYMLLTSCVTMPILVTLGQTVSVMMEICQKNLTSHVPPFKVTQDYWNRYGSIGNLILPISGP